MASEYVRLHIMKHALEHYINREEVARWKN